MLRNKQVAFHKRRRGPVRITDVEDSETEAPESGYNLIPTPEVNRVQEALKSSALELRAVVTDPLPEALQVAETIVSDLTNKNRPLESQKGAEGDEANPSVEKNTEPLHSNEADLGYPSTSHQNNVPQASKSQRGAEGDAANQSVEKSSKPLLSNGANHGNPSSSRQNIVPRPSLMARNGTAHTYEVLLLLSLFSGLLLV